MAPPRSASATGGTRPAQVKPVREGAFWQHPFVDVLKVFDAERRGDVTEELDRQICKWVLKIQGTLSHNNYLLLPQPRGSHKSLGLTGDYVYLQLKPVGLKHFLVHLDFTVAATSAARVTLTNMHSDIRSTHHSIQYPCPLVGSWAVVCIHVPTALSTSGRLTTPRAAILKSIQFCSSICVKSVFTSDNCYTRKTMPREMLLDRQDRSDSGHVWIDVPSSLDSAAGGASGTGGSPFSSPRVVLTPRVTGSTAFGSGQAPISVPSPRQTGNSSPILPRGLAASAAVTVPRGSVAGRAQPILSDPALQVSRLVGVSRRSRELSLGASGNVSVPWRFAVFVRHHDGGRAEAVAEGTGSDVLYAASMALVLVDKSSQASRSFFGHSQPIEVLEASDDGLWAASAQGPDCGGPPMLRLWRVEPSSGLRCLAVLSCPTLSTARVAAFDPGAKFLALSGADLHGRQQILVWDMGRLLAGGNVPLIAKQTSADWDIDCLRFSPFDRLHLVSCGRESVRFWRVKEGHLPGCSVPLGPHSRGSSGAPVHFTCLAFEYNKMGQPHFLGEELARHHRMFVATSEGKLLQLSYKERTVQVVYDLHTEAILSICANEGFVTTASADRYVRVWPLDFQSFFLHAMHETPLVGVDVSVDGLQVLCCTADGSVGVLDVQSHDYADIVHSHGAPVVDVAASLFFEELVTASQDGVLKVWSLPSMVQVYEFTVPGDVPCAVACHPAGRHLFAVGFRSGSLRVFDVDGLAMVCEYRHHVQPVRSLLFVADAAASAQGSLSERADVVTCDQTGCLVFYDEAQKFEVVRCPEQPLCAAPPEGCPAIVCAPPHLLQYLDPRCVAVVAYPQLHLRHKLRTQSTVTTFAFSFGAELAVVGTADSKVHFFDVTSGKLSSTYSLAGGPVCAVTLARSGCPTSAKPSAILLVATSDGVLRVFELSFDELQDSSRAATQLPQSCVTEQCFIGHALAPHRLLVTPRCVVTASCSEVICWGTPGNSFEHIFLDNLMTGCSSTTYGPAEVIKPLSLERPVSPSPVSPRFSPRSNLPLAVPAAEPPPPELPPPEPPPPPQPEPPAQLATRPVCVRLLGLSGCAASGPQALAWQPSLGILCHAVGNVVRVEFLHGDDGEMRRQDATVLALPGSEVIAMDLGPPGSRVLVVLSADLSSASGEVRISLSAWQLPSLSASASVDLPEDYAAARADRHHDFLTMLGGGAGAQEAERARGRIVVRALSSGKGAITSTPAIGDGVGGRVDVWRFGAERCELLCCASLAAPPFGIGLLSDGSGNEFVTLGAESAVFWRLDCGEGADAEATLQFQYADAPRGWAEDLDQFTCLCSLPSAGRQLLVVGTTLGRAWVYDADDNRVLAELRLADGLPVDSLSSTSWPHLVCGAGDTLRSFELRWDDNGRLEAVGSHPPLSLDGRIRAVELGPEPDGGVALTTGNTLWYFNVGETLAHALQSFHASPSRMMRCSLDSPTVGAPSLESAASHVPPTLATCSDDGQVRVWTCDATSSQCQPLLQVTGPDSCVSVCFLKPELLACGFFDGSLSLLNLRTPSALPVSIDVCAGDPLLVLEVVGPDALVVGCASGRLTLVQWQPGSSDAYGGPAAGAQLSPLHGPQASAPVCSMACDCAASPSRLLACFADLRLFVWDCRGSNQPAPRHSRTWVWPESQPEPSNTLGCSQTREQCLSMLSMPPLLATLLDTQASGALVVATAAHASSLYVYSVEQDAVLNRVAIDSQWPAPVRLRLLPGEGGSDVLMLFPDRFARLRILDGGTRARWLEEPVLLPGVSQSLRGCPDAAALPSGQVLVKTDAGISFWRVGS